jgi:hypothetical protein
MQMLTVETPAQEAGEVHISKRSATEKVSSGVNLSENYLNY